METNPLNAPAHFSCSRVPAAGDTPRLRPDFPAAATARDDRPICVDLDGTLVHSDLLIETAFEFVRRSPWAIPVLIWWALQGRAMLKRKLAESSRLDPAHLPYDGRLLDYLRTQRANGCTLILVTASHRLLAERIAGHVGLFHEVIATEGGRNLKGPAKADELRARFGAKGFYYAGDAKADLPVWRQAKGAILVNASPATRRAAARAAPVAADFPAQGSRWRALWKSLRIYQWVKNLLVFIPLLAAHQLWNPALLADAFMVFLAFGCAASGSYLINDLLDLESDRAHPRKRKRPFASGALPLWTGLLAIPLMLGGVALAAAISWRAGVLVAIYMGLTNLYSTVLKRQPLVDVFALASLYVIRILCGAVATGIVVSNWLLAFSCFLFFSLALIKRCAELNRLLQSGRISAVGRGYTIDDAQILKMMGIASSFVAALVLALYVDTDLAKVSYRAHRYLWGLAPLCLFWQSHLWLATERGRMHDDPILYAVTDRVSWMVAGLSVLLLLVAGS
jgi:4-hydroxybenzoate polyprenyltransferase